MPLNQHDLTDQLRRSLAPELETYDDLFETLGQIGEVSDRLEPVLLEALIDVLVSENVEFSVRNAVFEVIRGFASVQPVTVFKSLVHRDHADLTFDEVLISDMVRSHLDVYGLNQIWASPRSGTYQELIERAILRWTSGPEADQPIPR